MLSVPSSLSSDARSLSTVCNTNAPVYEMQKAGRQLGESADAAGQQIADSTTDAAFRIGQGLSAVQGGLLGIEHGLLGVERGLLGVERGLIFGSAILATSWLLGKLVDWILRAQ